MDTVSIMETKYAQKPVKIGDLCLLLTSFNDCPPCPPPPTLEAGERRLTTHLQGGTAPRYLYANLADDCSNCGLLEASPTRHEALWGDAGFL